VVEICRRLDGLPLAIELAAARIRSLSPAAILARLGPGSGLDTEEGASALPLLTGGAAHVPERQQTLRGAIAWSYDLLAPEEQALFRRLAVFAGGCTLEAAEQVLSAELRVLSEVSPRATDNPVLSTQYWELPVLDGLESLVAKSLLRRQDVGGAGGSRFTMLQTIREFALERLAAAGEGDAYRRRHAAYFAALAERAGPELRGADQVEWMGRLDQERHNIRVALRWCIESGAEDAHEQGLRLVAAIWRFFHTRGFLSEGREWLAALLATPAAARPTATRARALVGLGVLTCDQGDYPSARSLLDEGVAIGRGLDDDRGLASALAWFGHVVQQDDVAASRAAIEEALGIARRTGDDALIARTLNNLGEIARREGDAARAFALYEESLAIARDLGHQARIAASLHNLAHLALRRGDAPLAAASFAESLAVARTLNDQRVIAHCLAGLAGVAAAGGQPEHAARLFGVSEALLDAICSTLDPADRREHERNVAIARGGIDEPTFTAAWAAGRALPLAQALDEATSG
jgi:non-specific serine/threonine protein kinase